MEGPRGQRLPGQGCAYEVVLMSKPPCDCGPAAAAKSSVSTVSDSAVLNIAPIDQVRHESVQKTTRRTARRRLSDAHCVGDVNDVQG